MRIKINVNIRVKKDTRGKKNIKTKGGAEGPRRIKLRKLFPSLIEWLKLGKWLQSFVEMNQRLH